MNGIGAFRCKLPAMNVHFHATAKHHTRYMTALANGLARRGIQSTINSGFLPADILCVWGFRSIPAAHQGPVLHLEAGYINGTSGDYVPDRLRFISTSWNGMHGRAQHTPVGEVGRWVSLGIEVHPWRTGGDYALVIGQHPNDGACVGYDQAKTVDDLVDRSMIPVRFRAHPLIQPTVPLAVDLRDAALCVTWNSTAAVESVIAGVPTVALDAGSIARPVCSHDILEPPVRCDRVPWLADLAYRQWTEAELANGLAWEHLRNDLETHQRGDGIRRGTGIGRGNARPSNA